MNFSLYKVVVFSALAALLMLTGCAQETQQPTSTPTITLLPTSTITPTATQVWFPPTATQTPLPTAEVSPTPELKPGIGSAVVEDAFINAENWQLFETDSASAAHSDSALILVSSQLNQYIVSNLSGTIVGDGYLEAIIRLSLCGTEDEFGFIIRSQPDGDQYRLGMSCNGQVWVDRKYRNVFQPIVPKIYFGLVPTTAPDSVKISIWMQGSIVRFFIDDFYVFELSDNLFYSGGLGIYVRSLEGSTISASFSQLQISEISP